MKKFKVTIDIEVSHDGIEVADVEHEFMSKISDIEDTTIINIEVNEED